MSVQVRLGASNTAYLTLTAPLETIGWEARGNGACLRTEAKLRRVPKLIRQVSIDMCKRKLNIRRNLRCLTPPPFSQRVAPGERYASRHRWTAYRWTQTAWAHFPPTVASTVRVDFRFSTVSLVSACLDIRISIHNDLPHEICCCNEHKHARRRNKDTCPDDQRC